MDDLPRPPRVPRPRSLATRFMLANLVVVLVASFAVAAWVGIVLEHGVLSRSAADTGLYVESFLEPAVTSLAGADALTSGRIRDLDALLASTGLGQRVVSFRIWRPDGTIVYSPDSGLIGQRFAVEGGLARAIAGDVSAEFTDLSGPENSHERRRWSRLLETYVPVRERGGARVIAAVELYQLPDAIDAQVEAARAASWAIVVIAAILSYLLLASLVKQGSDTIERQHAALEARVSELSALLRQNDQLHQRLQGAADRATTLNEAGLRRIGSDLHDGPAQTLALALLRLDELEQGEVVSDAVAGALEDLRLIAAGLRSPSFESLGVGQVVERGVREHERRTGHAVALRIGGPDRIDVPVVVKIGLYRVLQEALSNAARHAGGSEVEVVLAQARDEVCLTVADRGPGFDPDAVRDEALGVAGMRERARLLGGDLLIETPDDGPGTRVVFRVPVPTGGAR